jgi:hypothetical protein
MSRLKIFWAFLKSSFGGLFLDWLTKLLLFIIIGVSVLKDSAPSILVLLVVGLMVFSSTLSLTRGRK